MRAGGVIAVVSVGGLVAVDATLGLNRGDLLPEPFRSLPFPNTAFRRDPLRFRGDLDCISCAVLLFREVFAVGLEGPVSRLSSSPLRRILSREKRLPDIDLLCDEGDFLFSDCLGVSSSILGNGMAESLSFESVIGVLIMVQHNERHGEMSLQRGSACSCVTSVGGAIAVGQRSACVRRYLAIGCVQCRMTNR